MKPKDWFFLIIIYSNITVLVSTCNSHTLKCMDTDCVNLIAKEEIRAEGNRTEYTCPNGTRLEYRTPNESDKTTSSPIACINGLFQLTEEPSVTFPLSGVVNCTDGKFSKKTILIVAFSSVLCVISTVGSIVLCRRCLRSMKEEELNMEEGNGKDIKEVSARSKSLSKEQGSGMKKLFSMESTNKKTSDCDDSSERKKSERGSKEKGQSAEQRSRGGSREKKGSIEKGGSREKRRSEGRGKSIEKARGRNQEKKGSRESRQKMKEEGGNVDKGIEGMNKDNNYANVKRPHIKMTTKMHGNTLKETEQAKLNQRKGKLPVPNLAKCDKWDDPLFEEILKVWMNFSINERIGFCDQMLRKMNGSMAVQFMRLFQNALFVETDRRVWTKLHECFRLLYAQCEAEYYMNICERMYQTVAASAADKLDKLGWQEKENENVDDAYIRYICADLVLFDCQTENIAKLFKTYEEKKFSLYSPLRIAVWTRVVREDDLSNEKLVLEEHLFEESKLPRVKFPTEEYGTKLQHLIYAASTSKDANFTKELWKRLVIEKEILPADLVFVFKGTMIYPNARKRCLDLFMEESFFREKIPSDCPEYKEILRLFANSCVREAELLKIKDHVMADFVFTDADKKSFDFEMLEKRMSGFLNEVPMLHATMNKYLIEDRDFLVHKK